MTVIHVAATLPRLEGDSVSLMALSTTAAHVPFAAPLRGVGIDVLGRNGNNWATMTQLDDSIPLTFRLMRKADVSGTSGTGHVADGVQFPDGTCVLRWRTAKSSTAVYASHADLMAIHGHDGATVCEWAVTVGVL